MVHNYGGVKIGVEYLVKKGYSKIAFVTVDLDQIQMHQREQGYIDTIKEQGLNYSPELILKLYYEQPKENSIAQIETFIQNNPGIDAVFFSTNYLGIYGLESIERLNLTIPDDIAVVCFDDHDIFRIFKPGITIIEQPIEEIAKTSIELLINTIDKVPFKLNDYQVIKNPALIVRGSA